MLCTLFILYYLCIFKFLITKAKIYMKQHVFLRLLIIDFVSNVHESPHDEINGDIFILHVFAYFG